VRGRGRLAMLAIACFVLGAGLMLAFDMAATRILGVLLLSGWIVLGAFALATPEYLGREDDSED
jgi:hypothetical protein